MEFTSSIAQRLKGRKKLMQDKLQARNTPQTTPGIIVSDSDPESETKSAKEMTSENVKRRIDYGVQDSAMNKGISNKKMQHGSCEHSTDTSGSESDGVKFLYKQKVTVVRKNPIAKGRKRGRPPGSRGQKSNIHGESSHGQQGLSFRGNHRIEEDAFQGKRPAYANSSSDAFETERSENTGDEVHCDSFVGKNSNSGRKLKESTSLKNTAVNGEENLKCFIKTDKKKVEVLDDISSDSSHDQFSDSDTDDTDADDEDFQLQNYWSSVSEESSSADEEDSILPSDTEKVKRKTGAKKTKAIPSNTDEENEKVKREQRAKNPKVISDSEEENEKVKWKPGAKKTKSIPSEKPRVKKPKLILSEEDDEMEEEDLTFENACHESKKNRTKTKQMAKKQKSTEPKQEDFVSALINSIMKQCEGSEEQITEPEVRPPSPKRSTLPLKFSFEDEEPKQVEKSEHEKMVDGLFDEAVMGWYYESAPAPEPEDDNKTETASDAHAHPCSKGNHYFYLDEEIGLLCRDCNYVLKEIRDIDPEFAPITHKESGRRKSDDQKHLVFNLDFCPGQVNFGDPFSAINGTVWDMLPGAKNKMYEHQQEGFEFLWKNLEGSIDRTELRNSNLSEIGGCIISHAPGTGKTLLTIVFMHTYLKLFPSSRPVIIAPASMLLTWEEEFKKWNVDIPFHNLNNLEFSGKENKKLRESVRSRGCLGKDTIRLVKIFSWSKDKSVLGISYSLYQALVGGEYKNGKGKELLNENAEKQSEKIKKILLESPRLIVMDEGHTPRNHRSCIWNTLVNVQTKRKVILTGTPFQNNFTELFNTLRLVRPATADLLLKNKTFNDMSTERGLYSRRKHKQVGTCCSNSRDEAVDQAIVKLKAAIAPFVHVHKGNILQRNLPGLKDSVIVLTPGPLQRDLIRSLGDSRCQSSFDYEYKLALISTHPSLFNHCGLNDNERDAGMIQALEKVRLNYKEGVKTKFVIELVRLSSLVHEKVLVFSQFIQVLKLIAEQLEARFGWEEGRHVIQMHGRQDQKYRQNLITKFNDPCSETRVLLASTKCCSEGINLVGASRVVLLDVVWNPSVERQAISRAYRLGQQKIVHTYHLMAAGTNEGDKYCRQVEKDRLSELVFSSTTKEDANIVKQKNPVSAVNDIMLQKMLDAYDFKDMFEKIIYQPKEANLIETFAMVSQL